MMLALNALLIAFAASAISLAISKSGIFKPVRERLSAGLGKEHKLVELISCPFCLSFWVSLGLSIAFQPLEGFLILWLSAWGASALIASHTYLGFKNS